MRKKTLLKKFVGVATPLFVVTAVLLSINFVIGRVNEHSKKTSVVSENMTYYENEKIEPETKKFEQTESDTTAVSSDIVEDVVEENKMSVYPAAGDIILPYSPDEICYLEETGDYRTHNGIDIKTENKGAVVVSDGVVSDAYYDINNNFVVKISHGEYTSIYRNISIVPDLVSGKKVKKGEIIGKGITGENGEEFIHFEVEKNGETCNPEEILNNF